jgi:hypothetical protein
VSLNGSFYGFSAFRTCLPYIITNRDSLVRTVTRQRVGQPEIQGSSPGKGKRNLFPQLPECLRLLFSHYRALFPQTYRGWGVKFFAYIGRCSAGTLAAQFELVVVFLSAFTQMPKQCLYQAKATPFQLHSHSSFTCHPITQYYLHTIIFHIVQNTLWTSE